MLIIFNNACQKMLTFPPGELRAGTYTEFQKMTSAVGALHGLGPFSITEPLSDVTLFPHPQKGLQSPKVF